MYRAYQRGVRVDKQVSFPATPFSRGGHARLYPNPAPTVLARFASKTRTIKFFAKIWV